MLAAFFCAFSVMSYTAIVYTAAEKAVHGAYAEHMISGILRKSDPGDAISGDGDEEINGNFVLNGSTDDRESNPKNEETPAKPPAGVGAASATHPIKTEDMSCENIFALSNQTGYSPDTEALLASCVIPASSVGSDEPLVLIIHTHATECYSPEGAAEYSEDTAFRTHDTSSNTVAVGDAAAEVLRENGIGTLHCTELFDGESYIDSYSRSAAAVAEYTAQYPTLRYVLDIHRDAVFSSDMTLVAPISPDGVAQIMLVCGTDEMGADFPDWEENLSFALALQSAAHTKYPGMMRNINLRSASFNEQLASRYLLVEVGSAGNTLESAKEAGRRFAEVFAGVIGSEGKLQPQRHQPNIISEASQRSRSAISGICPSGADSSIAASVSPVRTRSEVTPEFLPAAISV